MRIDYADRLKKLPPYLFEEIDKARKRAVEEGRDVIDLGVGDPDMPTPAFIVEKLREASLDSANHKYALNKGLRALREEIAAWYENRFGVTLDPDTEVLPLIGSKEGIAHVPLAFLDPGDSVLIPDPGYPPYNSGSVFAGANISTMPLLESNAFLPDLGSINMKKIRGCRLMHVNYPNNPTAAVCEKSFYEELVSFAKKHNIIVCSDAAYTEVSFDGFLPPSFLETNGAREVGIEFHSFSKTFNMTGWRIGMAAGNADIIAGLAKVKSNVDSGIFNAIQLAGIEALRNADRVKKEVNRVYAERRDIFLSELNAAGWKIESPRATFYVWAGVFGGHDSASLAKAILERCDIVVTPGSGFGRYGEGYVRMALTVDVSRLKEAAGRIRKAFFE